MLYQKYDSNGKLTFIAQVIWQLKQGKPTRFGKFRYAKNRRTTFKHQNFYHMKRRFSLQVYEDGKMIKSKYYLIPYINQWRRWRAKAKILPKLPKINFKKKKNKRKRPKGYYIKLYSKIRNILNYNVFHYKWRKYILYNIGDINNMSTYRKKRFMRHFINKDILAKIILK